MRNLYKKSNNNIHFALFVSVSTKVDIIISNKVWCTIHTNIQEKIDKITHII